jgi:hypothetical protein
MTRTEAIKGIKQARKRRERADELRMEAVSELRACSREAKAKGVSVSQIARDAGLSRQGVYDLLGLPGQPPSPRS